MEECKPLVYGDIPTLSDHRMMPPGMFLIPQLALSRIVYLLNYNCVVLEVGPAR